MMDIRETIPANLPLPWPAPLCHLRLHRTLRTLRQCSGADGLAGPPVQAEGAAGVMAAVLVVHPDAVAVLLTQKGEERVGLSQKGGKGGGNSVMGEEVYLYVPLRSGNNVICCACSAHSIAIEQTARCPVTRKEEEKAAGTE